MRDAQSKTERAKGSALVGRLRVRDLRPAMERLERALAKGQSYPRRSLSEIRCLVIHHSAVDHDSTAEAIATYHLRGQGWPGIGYHFLVHGDGAVEYVGDLSTVRYNVASRNREVAGICLPGDFTRRPPTPAALRACRLLVANLQYALGWFVPVLGHREAALPGYETSCPGDTFLSFPEGREGWKQEVEVLPPDHGSPPEHS